MNLVRDVDNRFDKNAVAVTYVNDHDEYLLGYIPSDENETIALLLEMGWNNIFECRISKINPDHHYDNQIRLTIKIKRNE